MTRTYALGAVKPNVRQAAIDAGNMFGITTILGVGPRPNVSDHPKGLALDFMTPNNSSKGDQVANFFVQNSAKYGVTYIIWQQRIWNVGKSEWDPMEDRGGVTANHYDHVHVSFKNVAIDPKAGIIPGIPSPGDVAGGVQDIASFFAFISNPRNWLRVAMFLTGGALMLLALLLMAVGSSKLRIPKSTIRTVTP